MPHIVHVKIDGDDGILVTFSDGTMACYIAEELLDLRPIREFQPDRTQKVDGNKGSM